MNEKLHVFFERLIKDYRFRERFMSTKTAKEGYELALPYLEDVSFEEFQEGLTAAYANVRANGKKPLSEEDYHKVSGGVACWSEVINVINSIM